MAKEDEDMELPMLTGDKPQQVCRTTNRNGEWINHTSKPISTIECIIDQTIVNKVRDFQICVERKLGGSNEFGGFVKWHWAEGKVIVDDFMIPKQKVGGATVDFQSPAAPGYTGVFHKHPTGCRNFSSVDDTYINANHDLSILFESGNFITGIVNIMLPDGVTRFQTRLAIRQTYTKGEDVDVSMVERAASTFREPGRGFTEVVRRPPASLHGIHKSPGSLDDFFQDGNDGDDELHLPHLTGRI